MFSGGEKTLSLVTIGKNICISLAKLYHTSYNFIHQIAIYVRNFKISFEVREGNALYNTYISTLRVHQAYTFFAIRYQNILPCHMWDVRFRRRVPERFISC